MPSCPRCVHPVPPGASRCPNCGYDLPVDVTAPPIPVPPPPVPAPPPPEQRPHRSRATGGVVLSALAILVVIVVLAAVRIAHRDTAQTPPATRAPTSTHPTSPVRSSPTISPQTGLAQATAIAHYLTESQQARQGIGAAISSIGTCTDIASAVTTLRNAAATRSRIVTELASTDVGSLPNGAAAVADLSQAMQTSSEADQHYAAWGSAVTGCHGHAPHNADLAAAQQADTAATRAKQRFAAAWNPIAARYGLPEQSADTI